MRAVIYRNFQSYDLKHTSCVSKLVISSILLQWWNMTAQYVGLLSAIITIFISKYKGHTSHIYASNSPNHLHVFLTSPLFDQDLVGFPPQFCCASSLWSPLLALWSSVKMLVLRCLAFSTLNMLARPSLTTPDGFKQALSSHLASWITTWSFSCGLLGILVTLCPSNSHPVMHWSVLQLFALSCLKGTRTLWGCY